jgi:cytochrome c peroxidase
VKARHSLLSISAAIAVAALGVDAAGAEEGSAMLSPQALQEIAQVEAEIDRIEDQQFESLSLRRRTRTSRSRVAARPRAP